MKPYLEEATAFLINESSIDPIGGLYEAADVQWWSCVFDELYQRIMRHPSGRPESIFLAYNKKSDLFGEFLLRPRYSEQVRRFIETTLEEILGLARSKKKKLFIGVHQNDPILIHVLKSLSFIEDSRQVQMVLNSELKLNSSHLNNFKLQARFDNTEIAHPLSFRNGIDIEEKLNSCSLYNSHLDNFATDNAKRVVAYCVTWLEPRNAIGVIEPFRTESLFQNKGIGKSLLNYSISKLRNRGAKIIKVTFETGNLAAQRLYSSVGFMPIFEKIFFVYDP